MEDRLANEILDAANNTGGAVKNVKTLTKWLKRTKHLLTTVGKIKAITLSVFRYMVYNKWLMLRHRHIYSTYSVNTGRRKIHGKRLFFEKYS